MSLLPNHTLKVYDVTKYLESHPGGADSITTHEDTGGIVFVPEPEAALDPALLQDMLDMVDDGMVVSWPDGINQLTARRYLERRRNG